MRIKPDIKGLIASLIVIIITLGLFTVARYSTLDTHRAETSIKLEHVRSALESNLSGTAQSIRALSVILNSNPNISRFDFNSIATDLLHDNPAIERIVFVRQDTIIHVYPLKGNENMPGAKYSNDTAPGKISTGDIAISGRMAPFNTTGPDANLVTTVPLYTTQAGISDRITQWGNAEIVINRLKLFRATGIESPQPELRIAIRQNETLSGINRILYGSDIIFQSDPVKSTILLPYGSLMLAAVPYNGWPVITSLSMFILFTGIALSIYCAYLLTQLEKMKLSLKEMSYHDSLTGLPNRAFFNDRLSMAISHAHRNKNKVAVFMIDLDRFKYINDTYGIRVGDLMLQKIAQRLLKLVRETDSVIRYGGDEFTLILPGIKSKEDAAVFEEKLMNAFKAPFLCGKLVLHVGFNIGKAVFPDDGDNIDGLIKTVDISLFQAKTHG